MDLVEDVKLIFASVKEFPSYLWFFAKQPEFVLGSAHGVFGVRSRSRAAVLLPVSFRRVADGAVRTGPAQILTEVLKGVVPRRLEARLKGLHHDGRILGETEDGSGQASWRDRRANGPPASTYPPLIHRFGGNNHPV